MRQIIFLLILLSIGSTPLVQADEMSRAITLSRDLNDDNKPQEFYYYVDRVDGFFITLTDGSKFETGFWYMSVPEDWKKGDRIQLTFDVSGSNNWGLTNVESGTIAWTTVKEMPKKDVKVARISKQSEETDKISKLSLSNGFRFKGPNADSAESLNWTANQKVMIFHRLDGNGYNIFNFDAKQYFYKAVVASGKSETSLESQLHDLEDRLNARVLQQPEATFAVTLALMNYAVGFGEPEKPVGVFLFLGPTGVGKTELAKALNSELYNDPTNLVRFDMSQFCDEWNITRLIGSAPGYVNHDDGGQLTNGLRAHPNAVVLLDEMEKAHDKIRKAFLPIFDEGTILDADNNEVNCRDAIFIMTSNLAGPTIAELFYQNFEADEILEIIEPTLMGELSPELYARTTPITFHPLGPDTMPQLTDLMLKNLKARLLKQKNIRLVVDESAFEYLVVNGFHPRLGARPLKKLIEKKVTSTLSLAIIRREVNPGEQATIYYSEAEDRFYVIATE